LNNLFVSLILFFAGFYQNRNIKTGTFYFYPPDRSGIFEIVRNDSLQIENNLSTGDSSIWKIKWQTDSVFTCKFLRGTKMMSIEEKDFYNAHVILFKIRNINSMYYTFSGGVDGIEGLGKIQDTIWFKPKINISLS
jgi:hypothetical protein